MVRLCNDIDVLKYEPALFGELHPTNHVLAAGSGGELAGTTFEAVGADFVSAGVEPGGVIYLRSADGLLDGAYEIVAVDSASAALRFGFARRFGGGPDSTAGRQQHLLSDKHAEAADGGGKLAADGVSWDSAWEGGQRFFG